MTHIGTRWWTYCGEIGEYVEYSKIYDTHNPWLVDTSCKTCLAKFQHRRAYRGQTLPEIAVGRMKRLYGSNARARQIFRW